MAQSNEALMDQPTPKGKGEDVSRAVQRDLEDRIEMGAKRYGERLKTFNGRDALIDAYQEVLDLAVYLKQYLMEQRAGQDQADGHI